MSNTTRKFEIKVPFNPPTGRRYWMRIGHATETIGQFGPMIMCTILTRPLNWDGEFALFPVQPKTRKKEVAGETAGSVLAGPPGPPEFEDYE